MGRLVDIFIGLMLVITVGTAIIFAMPFILIACMCGLLYVAISWVLDLINKHLIK